MVERGFGSLGPNPNDMAWHHSSHNTLGVLGSSTSYLLMHRCWTCACSLLPADFLPPVSPLDGLLHPQALMKSSEEVQQRLGSQPLPVWEWSTDWVEEMEAKYMQPAENWEAAVKPEKGRIAAPEEAQLVPTSIQQGTNDKCCCSKVEGHLSGMLKQ